MPNSTIRTPTDLTAESPEGLDLTALRGHLQQREIDLAGPLSASLLSGGKSNLTYTVTDGKSRWILRRPPLGDIPPGAHDVAREYRVMEALRDSTVPVPRTLTLATENSVLGVPFYMMDEVPGQVLRTRSMVEEVSEKDRGRLGTQLIDTLADLHEIDHIAVCLGALGRPEGYLQRQLDRWSRQYEKCKIRELDHVDDIIAALRQHLPQRTLTAIVHGDYRIDNVIVHPDDPGQIVAVLDWEMATLGDPLADLATLVMFWDETGKPFNPITGGLTAFPGFPSADHIIERYIARSGIEIESLDWYLVFAQFKLAVILEQIHARHASGNTVGEGFGQVGPMVPELLDAAMHTVRSSPVFRQIHSK